MAATVAASVSLPIEKDLEATWVATYAPRDGVVPKAAEAFRDYKKEARPSVRNFYRKAAGAHRERERERIELESS